MTSHHRRLSSPRVARLCACALLSMALAGTSAPSALAVSGSGEAGAFNELSQGGKEETAEKQKTETTGSTAPASNSKKTVIVALVAAVALLLAVAFVIVRDARKVAPAGDPQLAEARSAHDTAAILRKRRAKARAARRQRKRNRASR